MKKVVVALTLITAIIGLTGCQKEDFNEYCNCGFITDDGIDGDCYWVEIRNDCSNNVKRFCLTQGDWMTAYPGDNYCITNVDSW